MPRSYGRRYIPKPPHVRANLAALWAAAPTPEAQARVEAFVERTGGLPGAKDTTRKARQGESNEAAGRRYERLTRARLEADGYTVTKSQDSKGAADLVAYGPKGTRLVQVKSVSTYTPGCANEGIREILGLATFKAPRVGPGITREVWCWMRGTEDKPLVIVRIDHAGQVKVSGEPAAEVAKEVTRMLEAWGWEP